MVIQLRGQAGNVGHAAEQYDSVHGSMPKLKTAAIHAMRDDGSRYLYNNIAHNEVVHANNGETLDALDELLLRYDNVDTIQVPNLVHNTSNPDMCDTTSSTPDLSREFLNTMPNSSCVMTVYQYPSSTSENGYRLTRVDPYFEQEIDVFESLDILDQLARIPLRPV